MSTDNGAIVVYGAEKTHYIVHRKDFKIESAIDESKKTLIFSYNAKQVALEEETTLEFGGETYLIKEISPNKNGYRTVTAKTDLSYFENQVFETYEKTDTAENHLKALTSVGSWRIDATAMSTERLPISLKNTNSLKIIDAIRETFACEIKIFIEQKCIIIGNKLDTDNGVMFMKGVNLVKTEVTEDTYDLATRIIPIGKDGLKISDVNNGKDYLDADGATKIIPIIWEDSNYTDAATLKNSAQMKINELSKPNKVVSVKIVDLARYNPAKYSVYSFGLGDTIMAIDDEAQVHDKFRVMKIVEYPDDASKNTVELGNRTKSFADMQKKIKAAIECVDNVTNGNSIVINSAISGDFANVEISQSTIDRICT